MSTNNIRCLMIGQHGIGKSTFLKQFPNSKMHVNYFQDRENFTIECLNHSLEMVNIEIENCDISLDTCLFDTELIVNNKVIPSSKIINTCVHKVIILCFAMDDPGSFELIKSKWEIDLKKNKKNRHTFVLLGLKSDTVCTKKGKSNYDINKGEQSIDSGEGGDESTKLKQKKRSYSINSISSTSKLHSQKSPASSSYEMDEEFTSIKPVRYYKKFAKTIGANSFVKVSNNQDEKSFEKIVSYDKFIQNVCKLNKKSVDDNKTNNSGSLNSCSESPIPGQTDVAPSKKLSIRNRIPKSLSAPLKLITNRKSKTMINLKEQDEFNNQETSFDERSNELEKKKLKKNEKYENLEQTETSFSIKDKLSRFVIDIGTYVVTCGGSNSRKLAHLKGQNEFGARLTNRFYSGNNNRSFRRKKSLLLISSELSLNTMDKGVY